MGVVSIGSSSSHDKKNSKSFFSKWKDDDGPKFISPGVPLSDPPQTFNLPNPDPNNYKILRSKKVMSFLILDIKYHDCLNYEGNKILVFENCTLEELQEQKLIDPHFSENKKYHSPIARFKPTDRGWKMACHFALHYNKII